MAQEFAARCAKKEMNMNKIFRSNQNKKQAPQILLTVSQNGEPINGIPASTDEESQIAIQRFFGKYLAKPVGPQPGGGLICIQGGRRC